MKHLFDHYNFLKLSIPKTFKPSLLKDVFHSLVGGNVPFEFLIGNTEIEYPDHKGLVTGEFLQTIKEMGIKASYKGIYAYDIEILPNFFSVILKNINDPLDTQTYTIYGKQDDRPLLNALISQPIILIGFNSESFDDILLKLSLHSQNLAAKDFLDKAYRLAQNIISSVRNREYWAIVNKPKLFFTIDLMRIMALDVKGVSLKRCAIIMGHDRIEDLPHAYNQPVKTKQEVSQLLHYNLNDVVITEKLYHYIQKEIKTRLDVGQLFKESLMCASRSHMGNLLITKLYSEKIGKVVKDGYDESRMVEEIKLGDCIGQNIEFVSPELKEQLALISDQTVIRENKYKFQHSIGFGGITYDLGVGGLHSRDNGGVFESSDGIKVIDCDVSSFYPYIICNNMLYPKHLGPQFVDVYKGVVEERIRAKRDGEKTLADALKISINAVFGRLGSKFSWLYDMQVFLSVTISGQLYLLSLIEKLVLNGFKVISANTDGIVSLVPTSERKRYEAICAEWSELTRFDLEFTEYKKYVRRDVNNYLTLKHNGDFKTKGIFTAPGSVDLGYRPAIISKALHEYFINDIPPLKTIHGSETILDFLYAQKAAKEFNIVYEQQVNGEIIATPCQSNNRYFVSQTGGALVKVKRDDPKQKISMVAGESVVVLNDIESFDPKDYNLKTSFYLKEIEKIIHQIEPIQKTLF